MALRVLHLVGSADSKFYCDLSRLYAQDCLEFNANTALYEFYILGRPAKIFVGLSSIETKHQERRSQHTSLRFDS